MIFLTIFWYRQIFDWENTRVIKVIKNKVPTYYVYTHSFHVDLEPMKGQEKGSFNSSEEEK